MADVAIGTKTIATPWGARLSAGFGEMGVPIAVVAIVLALNHAHAGRATRFPGLLATSCCR